MRVRGEASATDTRVMRVLPWTLKNCQLAFRISCMDGILFVYLQPSYRLAIRTEGMIEDLVRNLRSESAELQMHCASAIFKVSRQHSSLPSIVGRTATVQNYNLLFCQRGLSYQAFPISATCSCTSLEGSVRWVGPNDSLPAKRSSNLIQPRYTILTVSFWRSGP